LNSVGGGTLQLSNGTFNTSGAIYIRNNTLFTGVSRNATKITASYAYWGCLFVDDSDNNTIQNCAITASGTDAKGIRFNGSDNNTIQNCAITASGTDANGIYIYNVSNNNTIQNCAITAGGTDAKGIHIYNNGSRNNNILNNFYATSISDFLVNEGINTTNTNNKQI
jgi:parallel beta-helix repeat protein